MRFLTKDVNRSLLVLIVFFLIIFTGFTVYSTYVLKGTSEEKYVYDEKLGKITADIILENLNKSNSLKDMALIDKAVLENKYNELSSQYNQLNEQKDALEEEVITLKSQNEYANTRPEGPVAQFRLIQEKNKEINELKKTIEALCSRLNENNISVKECY